MPTLQGKVQRGDKLHQIKTGAIWQVIKRLGNDELYAVRMVPVTNAVLLADDKLRGYAIMTEVSYYLKHGWEIVK